MKKTIIFASVAIATLFAFSSCQKEDLQANCSVSGVRIITAEFENTATKTTLNEDGKTPEWKAGDMLRILNGTTYQDVTLADSVIAGNKITFETAMEGTLYAVYPASATTMVNCPEGKITFTIPTTQDGTFASANICVAKSSKDDDTNKDNLVFSNATAVLKINTAENVLGVKVAAESCIAGSVIASFDGNEVSLGTDSLSGTSVFVVSKSAPSDNVFYLATAPVTTGTTTVTCYTIDKEGSELKDSKELQKSFFYSMNLSSMELNTDSDLTGTKGMLNGHEYVIIRAQYDGPNLFSYLKWATMNIGATEETGEASYGKLYSWGNINGQSGNSFNSTYSGTEGSLINNPDYPWDKTKHDAAYKEWGSPWRMPTGSGGEFQALHSATKWTWKDGGYYVTKSDENLSTDKSNALLFFPAAGYANSSSRTNASSSGRYWSSTWKSSSQAYTLFFTNTTISPQQNNTSRSSGNSVRPVSD